MGRTRTIKAGFFRSPSLARVPIAARLTYIGLWGEADDAGRGIADSRILKGALWPLEDDVTYEAVGKDLESLANTGHLVLYESGGQRYYHIISFNRHQSAAYRRSPPLYPPPPGVVDEPREQSHDSANKGVQMRAGREGKQLDDEVERDPNADLHGTSGPSVTCASGQTDLVSGLVDRVLSERATGERSKTKVSPDAWFRAARIHIQNEVEAAVRANPALGAGGLFKLLCPGTCNAETRPPRPQGWVAEVVELPSDPEERRSIARRNVEALRKELWKDGDDDKRLG